MEGKLIKENNGYTLFVDGKVFGDTDGHQLKSITNRLSIKNCQIIELDCDLDELAKEECEYNQDSLRQFDSKFIEFYKEGFQKALELVGDKKFSEKDMRIAFFHVQNEPTFDEFIQPLQQTEWEVELVTENVCGRCYSNNTNECWSVKECSDGKYDYSKPLLDADGCLILKKYKNG